MARCNPINFHQTILKLAEIIQGDYKQYSYEVDKTEPKVKLEQYNNIYFLGIGGIGMSALARWFLKKGLNVSGYDKTATVLTAELQKEGMKIHFNDGVEFIPKEVVDEQDKTLVIFTPAIPKDHKEHDYLKAKGYTIHKRSEVLGLISKD